MAKGEYPYLPVLDEILGKGSDQGIDMGLAEIPVEFIVGTKTQGRTRSFARNFMPLMEEKSEFAVKWSKLCDSHLTEGIRDPVEVWEYMNRFYVQEGNKRVSVLKYFGAVTIPARVKRILPEKSDDPAVIRYYEFLEFSEKTGVKDLEFSKPGSYKLLLTLLGISSSEKWTKEETRTFTSVYYKFEKVYRESGGGRLKSTAADAMLMYIQIFGYDTLKDQSPEKIRKSLSKLQDQLALMQEDDPIELKLDPEEKADSSLKKAGSSLVHMVKKKPLKIAFFYDKDIDSSRWSASHDTGRTHIEEVYGSRIMTTVHIKDPSMTVDEQLNKIIKDGNKLIFVAESRMVESCLRLAVEYPDVDILNCSLNKPYRNIRTYYPRMYEAKYVAGAIAGALSENDRIGFISRYPIYGSIAEINAFARGAALVNPRAKIFLEWSSLDGITAAENRLKEQDIHLISYRDFYDIKEDQQVVIGLTDHRDGVQTPLALPVWNWAVFYEKITDSVLEGTYRSEYKKTARSLNYYWGMSADAVDIILSGRLPEGVRHLGEILHQGIREGRIAPFQQEGPLISGEDIITMDHLEKNVEGRIPQYDELDEPARELVDEMGIDVAKNK
jgi:basic membrane lipoprotein Med (substrate-binding protein (PBP1-ABC) superfamily)